MNKLISEQSPNSYNFHQKHHGSNFYYFTSISTSSNSTITPVKYSFSISQTTLNSVESLVARYNEPSAAQFVTQDPMLNQTDQAYSYAGGNPVNSWDPSGMYDYHFQESLGPASSTATPKSVMLKFKQHFKQVFPFPITGCNSLYNGAICTLHPGPKLIEAVGNVKVFNVTSTSFSFVVQPCSDYFDPPGSVITFWDDLPYVDIGDGSSIRLLQADIENGVWVVDTLFKPGTVLQKHKHTGSVHAFTQQGRWKYLEYPEVNTAGSYLFEPAGSIHTLVVLEDNEEDTIVNFVISGANLYLDSNDQVAMIVDAAAVKFIYDLLASEKGYFKLPYVTGGKYGQS